MRPDRDALEEIFGMAQRMEALLDPFELTPKERVQAARWLFGGDSDFIQLTARGVKEHRGLFPEFPGDPQELAELGERGERLLEIGAYLQLLAQRLKDQGLKEKSLAVEIAMAVVKQVRSDEERPFQDEKLAEDRRRALVLAEKVLAARKKRNLRAQRLHEREKQKKAAPP